MRIAKVTSFFWPVKGGMEGHLYYEGKELIKLGHQVHAFSSNGSKSKEKLKSGNVDGIQVTRLPALFFMTKFTHISFGLLISLLFDNYDILHVHSYRQPHNLALLIAKLRGKPAILSTHWPEYPDEIRGKFVNKLVKLYDKTIGRFILKLADKIIVQTGGEERWLIDNFNIDYNKITEIPPGIHEFYLKQRDSRLFRRKYKIKEKNIVLSLGRVHKSKGFDKLIRIAKHFPNTKFVFVGPDDGYSNYLKNLAEELGVLDKILFTGAVSEEEKLEAYAACDVFVLPSDYEAFGIVLLEAMAQSKPVIASNDGGMPFVVLGDGYNFNDIEELEKYLHTLLNDKKLARELGKDGKKRAKYHTWEILTKRLENLYKKELNK